MPAPKNAPEILTLSLDAQAVLAGHWMFGPSAELTLQNQASVLSDRGAAAISELVREGMLSDEKADDGYAESRTYRLTEKAANMEFRKSIRWLEENGKFSITQPKASDTTHDPQT